MTLLPGAGTLDRRRQQRGAGAEPVRAELVAMVLGTFREMPGLCLHLNQAARLFGVHPTTCQVLLDDLVALGRLRRAHDGQYLGRDLADPLAAPSPMPSYSRVGRGH
ncbi:MAG TPA: hypothetical protein VFT24_00725 [Vicinamibacterales bacterium]|nr:hypothetical protein [Vicinamibacterales bacterium]